MAPLNFSAVGYEFSEGIRALREGYRAATETLEKQSDQIATDLLEYRKHVASGGERDGEWDEDGYRLWERDMILELNAKTSQSSIDEVRKAFAIAFYHHWERSVRSVTNYHGRDHSTLLREARKHNIDVKAGLERIRHLVNTLKHNNDQRGNELLSNWPQVFPAAFLPKAKTDWYSAIKLSDVHVSEISEIIGESGPEIGFTFDF